MAEHRTASAIGGKGNSYGMKFRGRLLVALTMHPSESEHNYSGRLPLASLISARSIIPAPRIAHSDRDLRILPKIRADRLIAVVGLLPLILALLANYGCNSRPLDPEKARAELDRRGIENNAKNFLASVKAGNVDVVKIFLDAGMDPNTLDESGQTASMQAARAGESSVLRVLIERGTDLRLTDNEGRTALHCAAGAARGASCVRLLLDSGADPNAKTNTGNTPLLEAIYIPSADTLLEAQFLSRYTEAIALLLDRGSDVNATNRSGFTPLMRAAAFGNAAVVRTLVGRGADVTARDIRGRSARGYALENGNKEAARIIELAGGA